MNAIEQGGIREDEHTFRREGAHFVTGVGGLLGSSFAKKSLSEGHEVIGCEQRGWTKNIVDLQEKIVLAEVDLLDSSSIIKFAEKYPDIDSFVNFAAEPHVGESLIPTNQHLFYRNILGITESLLKAVVHLKDDGRDIRLVLMDTAEMGGNSPQPHGPYEPYNPSSYYAEMKVASHTLAVQAKQDYGIDVVFAYLFNTSAEHQQTKFFLPHVATAIVSNEFDHISPLIIGNPATFRDYTYSLDTINGIYQLTVEKDAHEAVAFGTERSYSGYQAIQYAFALTNRQLGKHSNLALVDKRLIRPVDREVWELCADATTARSLGWIPEAQKDMADILPRLISYYRKVFDFENIPDIPSERIHDVINNTSLQPKNAMDFRKQALSNDPVFIKYLREHQPYIQANIWEDISGEYMPVTIYEKREKLAREKVIFQFIRKHPEIAEQYSEI